MRKLRLIWPVGKAEKTQDVSLLFLHVSMHQLRLMATDSRCACFWILPRVVFIAKPQKPRMSAHSRMLWRVNRLMVIGQGRKNPGCQSIVFTRCECINSVWWRLAKTQDKLLLMATGQSRRNPGCQSSVYMLWRVNSVWWPLGKAEKNEDVSLVFTRCDA